MTLIEITVKGKKVVYNSDTRKVVFFTTYNVLIECEMPKNWALTRIVQFMESAIKYEKNLI